jgi:hypothetical protein
MSGRAATMSGHASGQAEGGTGRYRVGKPPGRPPSSFARRAIAVAVGVSLLVVLLALTLRGGAPALYWRGERIADESAVLADAEAAMNLEVRGYEGVLTPSSRCWFVLPNSSAHDVEGRLECGPALLPWSSPGSQWLTYQLLAVPAGDEERLYVATGSEPTTTVALSANEVLRGPGGGAPPAGSGGLRLPRAPRQRPGWGGVLDAPPDGLVPAPVGDVLGDWGATYRLVAFGSFEWLPAHLDRSALKLASWPARFGRSSARLLLPPRGWRFVVADLVVSPGEDAGVVPAQANGALGPSADKPTLSLVTGSSSVSLPFAAGPDVAVAAVAPARSRPLLEVSDKGLTQYVSLSNGALGPAPEVLSRLGTDDRLSSAARLGVAQVKLEDASLVWFAGSDGGTVPPSYADAYLQVLSTVSPAGAPLGAGNFKLVVPGGQVVAGQALPDSYRKALVVGFLVPASFSYGTVVVSAGGRSLRAPVRFQ